MEAAAEELQEGAHVTPNLKLVSRIGAGGMGSVWIAEHLALETQVAVKFIAQTLANDAGSIARFKREAAAAANVKSPHVVQVLDYGVTSRGTPFIVMELLEGRDLRARIAAGVPMPARETSAVVRQVARALSRAHEQGIVHRDIKPENVFLCRSDDDEPFVKVLDFGVAKRASEDGGLTTTGTTVGTPYYMSPEQLVGSKGVDARSDLWSVGVMTFFMLTGKRPFTGETAAAVAVAIHNGALPVPTKLNAKLPPAIDGWFAKACARDPNERFATAKELATSLARALESTPSAAFEAVALARDEALDQTVPASAQSFPSSGQPTRRDAPMTTHEEAPSSAAMSASANAAATTARSSTPTRMIWGLTAVALLAAGVLVVRLVTTNDTRATSAAPSKESSSHHASTSTPDEPTHGSEPTNTPTPTASAATSASTSSSPSDAPKPKTPPVHAPPHTTTTTTTTTTKPTTPPTTQPTTTPPPADDLPTLK